MRDATDAEREAVAAYCEAYRVCLFTACASKGFRNPVFPAISRLTDHLSHRHDPASVCFLPCLSLGSVAALFVVMEDVVNGLPPVSVDPSVAVIRLRTHMALG